MNSILKLAAAAVLGLVALPSVSSAAPISTGNLACGSVFGPTELGGTTPGTFGCPMFDSATGPLLSIQLTITGNISGTITLTNNGTSGPNFRGTTITDFDVAPLAGFAFTSPMFTTTYTTGFVAVPGGQQVTLGTFNDSDQQTMTNTSVGTFGNYQNLGGIGTFSISVSTLTSLSCNTGGGNGGCSQVTDAGASATVRFTYDDGSVSTPEPASMALLGAGLLGFGMMRRRLRA